LKILKNSDIIVHIVFFNNFKKNDHGEKTSPSVDAYGRVGYSSLDEGTQVQTNQGDMHYMIT